MLSGNNNYTISIPVGTVLELSVPLDISTGHGYFPYSEQTIDFAGKTLNVYGGFAVFNDEVGTLEEVSVGTGVGPTVRYTHKKQKENTIYFFSDNGIYQTIAIVNVPIHDHSSIIQGGPAFGTYYTDYRPEE